MTFVCFFVSTTLCFYYITVWHKLGTRRTFSFCSISSVLIHFIHHFMYLSRYTEPASRSFGHHHRRFCAEAFQAGRHRSSQGVHRCLSRIVLSALRSGLRPLWKYRSGWSHCLISGVCKPSFYMDIDVSEGTGALLSFLSLCLNWLCWFMCCTRSPEVSYNQQTLLSQCNMGCTCSMKHWDPVCAYNGMTYASPCLAGCQTSTGIGKEMVSSSLYFPTEIDKTVD